MKRNCKKIKHILSKSMNLNVKFDDDLKFCLISQIGKQIWKWEAKNQREASKAPQEQCWVKFGFEMYFIQSESKTLRPDSDKHKFLF